MAMLTKKSLAQTCGSPCVLIGSNCASAPEGCRSCTFIRLPLMNSVCAESGCTSSCSSITDCATNALCTKCCEYYLKYFELSVLRFLSVIEKYALIMINWGPILLPFGLWPIFMVATNVCIKPICGESCTVDTECKGADSCKKCGKKFRRVLYKHYLNRLPL